MHPTAKMANLAKNRQRTGENVGEITRGAPGKYGKKIAMGLANIQVGCQRFPLGDRRL